MLDVAVIVKVQRNELFVHLLDLKHKIRDNEKLSHTVYDTHKIVTYNNKIYVP